MDEESDDEDDDGLFYRYSPDPSIPPPSKLTEARSVRSFRKLYGPDDVDILDPFIRREWRGRRRTLSKEEQFRRKAMWNNAKLVEKEVWEQRISKRHRRIVDEDTKVAAEGIVGLFGSPGREAMERSESG